MTDTHQPANEQAALWNGPAGRAWVEAQELLDGMFKPFEDILVKEVSTGRGSRILDVGCGTGAITLAIARQLGEQAHCVGVDISEPMLDAARARAVRERVRATFLCADAETHAFEPASFDVIASRFGVMFFDDPVRAFTNLRRAATDNAGLRLIVWRSGEENPFMTTAERAAAPILPGLPPRIPNAPGQFAFGDRQRVHTILQQSGWAGIEIQPIDVACTFPDVELVRYATRLGPVGRILQESDDQTRSRVTEAIRSAFNAYVYGDEVRYTAACWMISAEAARTAGSGAAHR